jgi:hypothetical protein
VTTIRQFLYLDFEQEAGRQIVKLYVTSHWPRLKTLARVLRIPDSRPNVPVPSRNVTETWAASLVPASHDRGQDTSADGLPIRAQVSSAIAQSQALVELVAMREQLH